MSILTQALRRFGEKALKISLPNSCLLCGNDSSALLCPGCVEDLPLQDASCCPRCAEPITHGACCGHCLREPPHFDATTALYRYDFPLDRLIHALKYGGQLALAAWFGERLTTALRGRSFDLLLPMPLHPERLQTRGFNQAAEIARTIGRHLALPVALEACQRSRPTCSQAQLPLQDRRANVRGAFQCAADLSGKRILVIDDVMTSGATLSECARTLKLHGAAHVEAAVVARALRN